jgi:hypothetical protein
MGYVEPFQAEDAMTAFRQPEAGLGAHSAHAGHDDVEGCGRHGHGRISPIRP